MTLHFDLGAFANDADYELLNRIPQRVAAYYLALPLAREEGQVTVVTAYPENVAALKVLERLLQAEIVPVASSEIDLQAAIARIYPVSAPLAQSILVWTDEAEWCEAVIMTGRALGRVLDQGVHILDCKTPLAEVMAAARQQEFSLLVTHMSDEARLIRLVRLSPTSLLLVRGEYVAIDNLLVALRGYGSDHEALDRVLPLIVHEAADATVLPLARSASSPLNEMLTGDTPIRQHLRAFLHELDQANVDVAVRLRQGEPATQVITELAQGGPYELLVIAAEADGDFVWHVLSRIEREAVWPGHPILIVKPPVNPVESTD